MKNRLFIVYCILFLTTLSCKEQPGNTKLLTKINFTQDTFYFNTIKKGDIVEAFFDFKNSGDQPLIIKNIGKSCGCKKATTQSDTISPNHQSRIWVTYNSSEDAGKVLKTIVVESNTKPALSVLYIAGNVQ